MKIKLEYPYCNDWENGYLTQRKTGPQAGRRNVSLYNHYTDASSVSYARYLMAVHLGRYLNEDEHVDHINNDRSDDRIENLQILSPSENSRKSAQDRVMVRLLCPCCKNEFVRRKKQTHLSKLKNKATYCSRRCSGLSGTKHMDLSGNVIEIFTSNVNDEIMEKDALIVI